MSDLRVSSIVSRKVGTSPKAPDGVIVSGIATATTFEGNLTGNATGNVTGNVSGNITGNISGATGTFSGDVSVGGTVTYEDVSSVDSVGVITARDGIRVGAGQSISAVSGIVTYYGDGSQLTGVESGAFNFTASGTLSNGQTVLINTDGTVSAVRQTVVADSFGSDQVWESDRTDYVSGAYIGGGKYVIGYQDYNDSQHGKAIVATVNGKTVSFGTPYIWESSGNWDYLGMCYDSSADRVVFSYKNTSNNTLYGIVGQVSGTAISFGSAVQVFGNYGGGGYPVLVHDSSVSRNVVCFRSSGNTGTSVVLSVSGTTLNVHSSSNFRSAQTTYIAVCYDSNAERIVVGYCDQGASNYFRLKVGNVSSTSVTYGAEATISSDWVFWKTLGFDPSVNKVIAYYADYNANGNNTNWGRIKVGTVDASNNTISFGSAATFAQYNVNQRMSHTFDSDKNVNYLAFRDLTTTKGNLISHTTSGNNVSLGSTLNFTTEPAISARAALFDTVSKNVVITYLDYNNSNYGTSKVFAPGSTTNHLTAENYIGITAEAIADGATGKINIATGINEGQTGLTTGQKYYVQNDGSLSTSAGSPSVVAGTAISSTKIIVKG